MANIQAQPAPASGERGRLRKAPENFLDATGIRTVFAQGKHGRRDFIRSAFAAAMAGGTATHVAAQAKGVGEGALAGAIAAVATALADLGIDLHELPATPERVWRAQQAARGTQQADTNGPANRPDVAGFTQMSR